MNLRVKENIMTPINISNRLECFFTGRLVDTEKTTAEYRMHEPVRRETVMVHDAPWEGSVSCYHVIIPDGDKYRMYYRGESGLNLGGVICYAESNDCIHWTKPELGICEFNGSKKNNIIIDKTLHPAIDNFFVFKDTNPDCPSERLYKAVSLYNFPTENGPDPEGGLRVYYSADGIHFKKGELLLDAKTGAFDSMNVVFWDEVYRKYRCYFRGFHLAPEGTPCSDSGNDIRDVRYTESVDFRNWSSPVIIDDPEHVDIPLYTNNIQPYYREPHTYVGFPTRYIERISWGDSYDELCGQAERRDRMRRFEPRSGLAVTECGFMASSDGVNFRKYDEAWCPPLPEDGTNWVYGDRYFAYGMIEMPSEIKGADPEISMFSIEHHWIEPAVNLVRYTIRRDGFVSLRADGKEKMILTKEFTYDGNELYVNFATSAWGYMYFTLIDENGNHYQSEEHFGNSTHRKIKIADDAVKRLSGKPVRLEVRLRDADLYSIRFGK